MTFLRQYSDLFGSPGIGFHEKTIFGLAFWDLVGTLLIAYVVSIYYKLSLLYAFAVVFLIAQLLHIIFGVNTRFLNALGISF
jgi:hypothetical protein